MSILDTMVGIGSGYMNYCRDGGTQCHGALVPRCTRVDVQDRSCIYCNVWGGRGGGGESFIYFSIPCHLQNPQNWNTMDLESVVNYSKIPF